MVSNQFLKRHSVGKAKHIIIQAVHFPCLFYLEMGWSSTGILINVLCYEWLEAAHQAHLANGLSSDSQPWLHIDTPAFLKTLILGSQTRIF